MIIRNTKVEAKHPWPEGVTVQGGDRGVVFDKDGKYYSTAFVESFAGTFLRGEGKTISEAEDDCWAQYQRMMSCPHDAGFDRKKYVNGSGFCNKCDTWFSVDKTGLEPLPEYYEESKEPSFLSRVFKGEPDAIETVFDAMLLGDKPTNSTTTPMPDFTPEPNPILGARDEVLPINFTRCELVLINTLLYKAEDTFEQLIGRTLSEVGKREASVLCQRINEVLGIADD